MMNSLVHRLFAFGLGLVLTTGLLVGCGTSNSDSTSAKASEQQVAQQSEQEHEDEHAHEEEKEHSDHEKEGQEHDGNHERTEHFEGKKAETYDEAVTNMKQANSQFEEILAKDDISEYDLRQVHKVTYTMEDALKVIRQESDGDYKTVAENLESVHLASEERDVETVRQDGKKYLEGTRGILEEK